MKWLVRGFFALTVLAAAALIGGVFLPSRARVEREIAIDRPPATVFTMLSSLKTFHDWSPWAADQPDATFGFSGAEAGVQARYEWDGDLIGTGRVVVTRAEPYSVVEAVVNLDGRGRAVMTFEVEPKPGGSVVTWTYDADFGLDLIGRYVGRTFDARMGPGFEAGLVRLKALAEALPGADFADVGAEIVTLEPQPAVIYERQVRGGAADLDRAFSEALGTVRGFMAATGLREAGPPAAVTVRWEPPLWVFEAAVPYAGEPPPEVVAGDMRFGALPGGRAVRAVHRGPPEGVPPLQTKLDAYIEAHRLVRSGPGFEVRVSERNATPPAEQVTELYVPVE
jgi:effector-binding domain-containing protein